jgi:hypothetical protein
MTESPPSIAFNTPRSVLNRVPRFIEKIELNAFKAYLPQKFPRSPPFLFAFRFFNGLSSAYAQSNA